MQAGRGLAAFLGLDWMAQIENKNSEKDRESGRMIGVFLTIQTERNKEASGSRENRIRPKKRLLDRHRIWQEEGRQEEIHG